MTAETSNARWEVVAERQAWYEQQIALAEGQWAAAFLDRWECGDDVPSKEHYVALWLAERAAPPPAAARGDVPYDRELIARMLDVCGHPMFTLDAYREQARLLREADNAGAEKVGTARALTAAQQQGLRIIEPIRNCATPESREAAMVVLETDAEGNPTIWCDPEIADLVRALNVGGVRTKASCSGHGEKPFGIVSLQDGRELLVLPDWETTRRAERILDAGLSAQQQGQAVAECHCATCTCAPGMTPAVRFDASPAAQEGAVRDHLIALGWTPPGAQQPAPIAPVGVEAIAAEIRASLGRGATVSTRRRWAVELEALAQRPAAPSGEAGAFDANFLQSVASLCRAAYDLCQPKPQRTPEDVREHYGELCLLELTSIADEIERRLAAAEGVQPEGSRSVTNQLLHWGGIPVRVTGTVTTSPGNWPLIDAALAAQRQEPTT